MEMIDGAQGRADLVDRHRGRLVRYLRQRGRTPLDAEDLVQDLAVQVMAYPLPADPATSYRWLLTILRTLSRRQHRREEQFRERLGMVVPLQADGENDEDLSDRVRDPAHTPEQVVVSAAVRQAVLGGLERLSGQDQCLLLHLASGRSIASVAGDLGISRQAAWERTRRARQRLARLLPHELTEGVANIVPGCY